MSNISFKGTEDIIKAVVGAGTVVGTGTLTTAGGAAAATTFAAAAAPIVGAVVVGAAAGAAVVGAGYGIVKLVKKYM